MSFSINSLRKVLTQYHACKGYLVAYSGGLDSTVLLHALSVLRKEAECDLSAIYFDHQLQAASKDWAERCRTFCAQLGVTFHVKVLSIDHDAPEGIEAAARHARYDYLYSAIKPRWGVVTAHHADDQAETFLLQLFRGAGVKGLSAMPSSKTFHHGWHLRPLLAFTRAELKQYATQHNLAWIEDPTNEHLEFDRNYVRHAIMPAIQVRWTSASKTIMRAARHQADLLTILEDVAQKDLKRVASTAQTLTCSELSRLSNARIRNVMLYWMRQQAIPVPSATIIESIITSAVRYTGTKSPLIRWNGGEARRYRDDLYIMQPLAEHDATATYNWDLRSNLEIASVGIVLNKEDLLRHGITLPQEVPQVKVAFRQGGETIQPAGREHHHMLKKLFQEAGIPPWQRSRIPLLYVNNKLIAVYGMWRAQCDAAVLK